MSTNKYKPVEGTFFVEIEESDNIEIKSSSKSANSPIDCKKVTIIHTSDQETHPKGSIWMMGDVPPIKLNFFGEKLLKIEKRHLYARLD